MDAPKENKASKLTFGQSKTETCGYQDCLKLCLETEKKEKNGAQAVRICYEEKSCR